MSFVCLSVSLFYPIHSLPVFVTMATFKIGRETNIAFLLNHIVEIYLRIVETYTIPIVMTNEEVDSQRQRIGCAKRDARKRFVNGFVGEDVAAIAK